MLSLRTKIVLRLSGLILIVGIVAAILIYVAFQGAPTVVDEGMTPPTQTTDIPSLPGSTDATTDRTQDDTVETGEDGELPASDIADGGPVLTAQLTSSSIEAPTLVNGGQISYYDARDGRFYTIDSGGNVVTLSDTIFPQAEMVTFSDSGDKAAIEFPDGSNIIYDFEKEKQTTLPAHWQDFEFSSDGSEVASKSMTVDPNSRALVVSSADGSKTEVLAALGNEAHNVNIQFSPTNEIVAFSETGRAQSIFGRNEIYLIDRKGEDVGSLIVDGANFESLWSPDGSHLIYSVADTTNERPMLWYTQGYGNDIGSQRIKIPLETWAEKCTFKNATTLICAVPREMVNHGGFDHRFVTANDDVYQVNVATGTPTLIGSPVTDMQMSNLRISDDGSLLYFTDHYGRLNSMRLQ